MKNLAVLVSGTGSLLEAMIADKLEIKLVLADRPCRGLKIAEAAGIPTELVGRSFRKDFDRKGYTEDIALLLVNYDIDFVAMAGFMTVFDEAIFTGDGGRYNGKILNSHPSLLPSFKGEKAVEDALKFGAKVTGTTIHVATEIMDEGLILAQEAVRIRPGDTVDTLWERIKIVERKLYPMVIREFAKTI